ncbi:MAG: 4a-hydroxytetrahydrobiopterin dehydratase [Nitriliruptorales bacterium]
METLSDQEIEGALAELPGWEFDGEAITKTYALSSFREAIEFINDIADVAEDANHHPDLEIYYDKVVVSFRTHSADAVTDKDVEMAREVEALVTELEVDEFDDGEEFEDLDGED